MSTPFAKSFFINAANEGIPVGAIARVFVTPLDEVYHLLKDAKAEGFIVDLPNPDWPPGSKIGERTPCLPSDTDLHFLCHKTFKLTALEAGFLVVLMKHSHATKARLHNVVEQQRLTRSSQPDTMESTDPKMVDVIICKLRKKMKKVDPALVIETIWGGGYHIAGTVKPLIIAKLGEPDAQTENAAPITNGTREVAGLAAPESRH